MRPAQPQHQSPNSFSSQTQFNRKAFAWGNADAQRPEAKNGHHGSQEESQNRTYEIIAKTGTVKAEPHMDAKLKTKKVEREPLHRLRDDDERMAEAGT
mmetsp:Transcript_30793/g.69257  ORF Transcript_30793/g.69257 Transcript_30793/m.69257 type:complete len:98 (-) Transcript_30793:1968-2261(-)